MLVSNKDEAATGVGAAENFYEQRFETGAMSPPVPGGSWRLHSIGLRVDECVHVGTCAGQFLMQIWSVDAGGNRGELVANLSSPSLIATTTSSLVFRPFGEVDLLSGTPYLVHLTGAEAFPFNVPTSASDDETGLAGWSIGDDHRHAPNADLPYNWTTGANVLLMEVRGFATSTPNDPAEGMPLIVGAGLREGVELTADPSPITDPNGIATAVFAYEWQNASTTASVGTGPTYTPGSADVGKSLRLRVSFTDDLGYPESRTSSSTPPVAAAGRADVLPTGVPTIFGAISGTSNYRAGDTLMGEASDIRDADGLTRATFVFVWLDAVTGDRLGTGREYNLKPSDAGRTVKLRAAFTDDAATSYALESAATSVVAAQPADGCTPDTIELSMGNVPSEGDIRYCHDNDWRWVCDDDSWDDRGAEVACRQAGYNGALSSWRQSTFDQSSSGGFWLDDVQCTGTEATLGLCSRNEWGDHDCTEVNEKAGVRCRTVGAATLQTLTVTDPAGENLPLTPAFNPAVKSYAATATSTAATVTVTATPVDANATVAIGNTALGFGPNEIVVTVTGTGGGVGVYALTVTRPPPSGQDPNQPATADLYLQGSPRVGGTLRAMGLETVADADGLAADGYAYAWYRYEDGLEFQHARESGALPIANATTTSYTLTDADEGSLIGFQVSFIDGAGFREALHATTERPVSRADATPDHVVGLAMDVTEVAEGEIATLTVRLSEPASGALMPFALLVDTEEFGGASTDDYQPIVAQVLQFNASSTERTFTVEAYADGFRGETGEGIRATISAQTPQPWLRLSPASANVLIRDATATSTATSTDPAVVSIEAVSPSVTYSTAHAASYRLTRTGSLTNRLEVAVTFTQDKPYLDNTQISTTESMAQGVATKIFSVSGDKLELPPAEPIETGTLTATVESGPGYGVGAPASASVDIVPYLTIRLDRAAYTVAEDAGTLAVSVIARTGDGGAKPGSHGVNFSTDSVEARVNKDFADTRDTLIFNASDYRRDGDAWKAEHTIPVMILDDAQDEPDETFALFLDRSGGLDYRVLVVGSGGAGTGTENTKAIITIEDNDLPGAPKLDNLTLFDTNGNRVALVPEFASTTTTYTASAPYSVGRVVLTASTTGDVTATIARDNDRTTPNEAKFDLDVGDTVLRATASRADPARETVYTVTVTRNPPARPGAPRNLSKTVSGQTVGLSWNPPLADPDAPVAGYVFQVSSDCHQSDTPAWATRSPDSVSGTTAAFTQLWGTTRCYRVRASNAAGSGAASNEVRATTADGPPTRPRNLRATAVGLTQLDLSWDAPSHDGGASVTGYRIAGSGPGSLAATTGATARTYSHTGLTIGQTWNYLVYAVNTHGDSDPASVSAATGRRVKVGFEVTLYNAVEGGRPARVRLVLSGPRGAPLTIPLTVAHLGASADDYSMPTSVSFGAQQTSKTFTVTATDDNENEGSEALRLGFGTLPAGVTAGLYERATVSLVDDDGGPIELRMPAGTLSAREGGGGARVTMDLSRKARTELSIPLAVEHLGGATAADYTGVPSSVTFAEGRQEAEFTVRAVDDEDNDDNESLRISAGTLPSGVALSRQWPGPVTVELVDDDGVSEWLVSFGAESYTATEGGADAAVTVEVDAAVEIEPLEVRLAWEYLGGATAADHSPSPIPMFVTIPLGARQRTLTLTAVDDAVDDDGESVRLGFFVSVSSRTPPVRWRLGDGPLRTLVSLADNDGAAGMADAQVSDALLTLRYAAPLDGFWLPSGSDFVVLAGPPDAARELPVTAVAAAGAELRLTLALPALPDEPVRLSYLAGALHPLQDAAGERVRPLADLTVRNETRPPPDAPLLPALASPGEASAPTPDPLPSTAPPAPWPQPTESGRLDLSSRNLADLRALSALPGLTQVRELKLAGNALADAAVLATLAELRILDLSDNALADAWPLAELTALERLDLSGNRIADLSPLAGLAALERLDLSGNRIADISPLAGLAALEVLLLDGNRIADTLPLSQLPALVRLGLADNRIAEIALLAELSTLARLNLADNALTDISPLGDLSRLISLNLAGNPLADTSPLGRLTLLQWLWLDPAHPAVPMGANRPARIPAPQARP